VSAIPGSDRDRFERTQALRFAIDEVIDLDDAAEHIHRLNDHFYRDLTTGKRIEFTPEQAAVKIALMHSELSEMLEGVRKGTQDSHLPEFTSEEVELADLLIRALDYAGWRGLNLGEALQAKLLYNAKRNDHTNEARNAAGGKKF
jgi:NTP pyrophosphatase (non-canonical NTP hydrolase)